MTMLCKYVKNEPLDKKKMYLNNNVFSINDTSKVHAKFYYILGVVTCR